VSAKRVMRSPGGDACVAVTSAASNLLGVVFFFALYSVRSKFPVIRSQLNRADDVWFMSLTHGVGLYAAYRGLVGAKVSLVQAVKALEPLIAMGMSSVFLGKYPTTKSLAAAVVVVSGVITVSVEDTSYSVNALLWVLLSSFTTQGRNLLMKIQQQKRQEGDKHRSHESPEKEMVTPDAPHDSDAKAINVTKGSDDKFQRHNRTEIPQSDNAWSFPDSPAPKKVASVSPALKALLMFVVTSAGALPVNLIMIPFEIKLIGGFDNTLEGAMCKPGPVLTAGCTHFFYNLASFGVLSFVSPPTHSLANTAKRAVVVSSAAIILKDHLTIKGIVGLCLVITGSGFYSYFAKNPKAVLSSKATFLIASAFLLVISTLSINSRIAALAIQ